MEKLLSEEDFKKLGDCSYIDLEKDKDEKRSNLKLAYDNIITILKDYLDLREDYYNIIALWIIGTYFHENFKSYPFLFFNAIKGSGKSRAINIITQLSKDGEILLSPTEAVLFRTKGTLGIDEFEGIGKTGKEAGKMDSIRELLNASYKKGSKVKRMKQKKTMEGTEQVVEEFDVYRPIVMANIWGMESVLGDRCISLILEKSGKKNITDLVEIFDEELIFLETKKILKNVVCANVESVGRIYREWNKYVKDTYTNYTNNTHTQHNTKYIQAFKTINLMELRGREIELALPLCLVASEIEVENLEILKETTFTLKRIFSEKKEDEINENRDVLLLDFLSQEVNEKKFIPAKKLLEKFKECSGNNEEWFNAKWLGKALKRMNLIIEKRRSSYGMDFMLNYEKAQQQIKIFKTTK